MASRVAVVLGLVLASLRPLAVEGKIYRNYSDIGELSKNHASLSLSDILPTHQKTYDKNRAPKLLGQPTVVYFHVTVLSIDSINEESMTYVADIFLAQSWRDPRLRLPENMSEEYRILDVDWLHSIWRPDCFFKNAKKVTFHEMSIPNHYLWLYHDKTLLYMSKLTLVLSCAMKFESYPHDTQICSMMIESCKYGQCQGKGCRVLLKQLQRKKLAEELPEVWFWWFGGPWNPEAECRAGAAFGGERSCFGM
ncbi:glycine receptor subunit alpha-4-like [Anopheles merus]|uniref:glycine receptor subunit alpha-4-like n=1 Tax=Anopheles merus TaxID=30066 RepID=UPI001BE4355C|nr:glycine receptor subunit alpha-4-like [Anopheles merus]